LSLENLATCKGLLTLFLLWRFWALFVCLFLLVWLKSSFLFWNFVNNEGVLCLSLIFILLWMLLGLFVCLFSCLLFLFETEGELSMVSLFCFWGFRSCLFLRDALSWFSPEYNNLCHFFSVYLYFVFERGDFNSFQGLLNLRATVFLSFFLFLSVLDSSYIPVLLAFFSRGRGLIVLLFFSLCEGASSHSVIA